MLARPMNMRLRPDFQQQIEFLGEQGIVVLQIESEKRIGFRKRSPARDDLGAALRE